MPGPAAIPIIMAGISAARLVGPKLAESLISRGLAKKATGEAAKLAKNKVQSGTTKEINQVKDLPATVQNKMQFGIKKAQQKPKPSSSKISQESSTAAQNRARLKQMQEREAKQEAAKQAAKKLKPKSERQRDPHISLKEIRKKKLLGNRSYENYLNKALNKEKNQARVIESPTTPRSQKGMRLPRKGETMKRKGGGMIGSGNDLVASIYD